MPKSEFFREECLIDGRWISAPEKRDVLNPATGALVGTVPLCQTETANRAIDAARKALPAWRSTTAFERAALLRAVADLLRAHEEALAKILTEEQGKPLREARGEVRYASDYFEWFGEEAKRAYGDVLPSHHRHGRVFVTKESIGVVAAITPWNFPIAMLARKMAPALAAGCTFIGRPALETPLSALALAAVTQMAGVPAGVVNILTGHAQEIATPLLASPIVRKLTFTGSTEVGRSLMQQSAPTLKRLTMELGGNAPFIVFEDADLERAVAGAIYAKYRNAGQTCICVNRFFVHDKVVAEFSDLLAAASRKLHVGNGLDPDTDIGPLISDVARKKVDQLIASALSEGARITLGGTEASSGCYLHPTIVAGATNSMRIAQEEIFGPVAVIINFSSEAEVISAANDTEYGLASYIYTNDLSRAFRVSEALEYGIVGINETAISAAHVPFGGIKQSGFGREGGRYGLDEYLQLKYTFLGL